MKLEKKIVKFRFFTGIRRRVFQKAKLVGSWNKIGEYSEWWNEFSMIETLSTDGCPCFETTLTFVIPNKSLLYRWGVILQGPTGENQWGIPTEIPELDSHACYRTFQLETEINDIQFVDYYFTHCQRFGARKYYPFDSGKVQELSETQIPPGIVFSVWAPNAKFVELIFGNPENGYISEDGEGIDLSLGPFPMMKSQEGIWSSDPHNPRFQKFNLFLYHPYMYRITKENGNIAYRTDLYSYEQIGKGDFDPNGKHYSGSTIELDGTKSCSLVCDIERIDPSFTHNKDNIQELIPEGEFWETEFQKENPVPKRLEDLVIYELHIAALGAGEDHPGHFEDAMVLIPYLKELGINTVELLPIMEFEGAANWGYGTSHYFAVESSAGGRDQLKYFVRECHRQGIAVFVDVVFNHYHHRAERAQLHFDSDDPSHDIYYWYEGNPKQYKTSEGGYIDNMSTGYAPRYSEEMVRKMFISSAVMLIENFHIDGFRVDQTTSIHAYNVLHENSSPLGKANIFGAKFLRELTRTLKMIKPEIILIAEDHSDWSKVTESPIQGGLGFDATWYAKFYHNLIGGQGFNTEYACLLRYAAFGDDRELSMDKFAEILLQSRDKRVVYHESHDEAGNSANSARTIEIAVNRAPLQGLTRFYAESRSKVVAALNIFSAGVPLFFMGEEVGANKDYTYFTFMQNREDLLMERSQEGRPLFIFYQDLIFYRLSYSAFRSHNLEIIHVHNQNRILVFRRWDDLGEFLVVISLNNHAFLKGYFLDHPIFNDGLWKEVLNSDAKVYSGTNIGNSSALIPAREGRMEIIIPANSVLVFRKQM